MACTRFHRSTTTVSLFFLFFFLFFSLDDEEDEEPEEEEEEEEDVLEVGDGVEPMDEDDRKSSVHPLVPAALAVPLASPSPNPPTMSNWMRKPWNPITIKGMWQDAVNLVWHIVLVILLPSGVGQSSTEDITLTIESNGTVLAVELLLPLWITNQNFLSFLKQTLLKQAKLQWKDLPEASKDEAEDRFRDSFALMAASLRTQMIMMREDPTAPTIKATAKIQLDIPVKPITPEDWQFIGSETGVRMLFVDLKAPSSTSYEAKPVKDLLLASK